MFYVKVKKVSHASTIWNMAWNNLTLGKTWRYKSKLNMSIEILQKFQICFLERHEDRV